MPSGVPIELALVAFEKIFLRDTHPWHQDLRKQAYVDGKYFVASASSKSLKEPQRYWYLEHTARVPRKDRILSLRNTHDVGPFSFEQVVRFPEAKHPIEEL